MTHDPRVTTPTHLWHVSCLHGAVQASRSFRWAPAARAAAAVAAPGLAATVPMTLFMLAMHRVLPKWERYALPPQEIVEKLATRAGIRGRVPYAALLAATLVSHFGYGSSAGAGYAVAARAVDNGEASNATRASTGALYGLTMWAGGYLGWLPVLRILPPVTRTPPRRTLLMVGAHVVWGCVLGLTFRIFDRRLSDTRQP